jgi:peptidoglycan hydrolase CwlO-like protein
LKDFITALAVTSASLTAQIAQAAPADLGSLEQLVKSGGVIGLLCLVVGALLKERTDVKKEYKEEMAKKDAKIESLEERLDAAQGQINDLRRHVLSITPPDVDTTATIRRSTLKLKEQQENA